MKVKVFLYFKARALEPSKFIRGVWAFLASTALRWGVPRGGFSKAS